MASRHSSLLHKLHCLLHSLWLIIGSWALILKWCAGIIAFATDLGVESGLACIPTFRVQELFPWFQDSVAARVDAEEDLFAEDPPPAGDVMPDANLTLDRLFLNAVPIAGGLHVCHGATTRLTDSMENFESWFDGFNTVWIKCHMLIQSGLVLWGPLL